MKKRWIQLSALTLVVMLLGGMALLTHGATADDPMVTLSYLNGNFKSDLMASVQSYGETASNSLSSTLQGHTAAFESKLTDPTLQNATVTSYQTVELVAGKTYPVTQNMQILVVSGAATVSGSAVSDVTSGASVAAGGSLQANHLYLTSGSSVLTATSDAILLVK